MAAMQRVEARDAARHCTEHTTQHSPCHREISGLTCLQYKVEKLWASRCGVLWSQITLPGHDSACAGTICQDLPQQRWWLLLHMLLAHPGSKSGTWLQPLLSGCRQLGRAPQHCYGSMCHFFDTASASSRPGSPEHGPLQPANSSLVRQELLQLVTERAASWA